jgi:hypothetical protein
MEHSCQEPPNGTFLSITTKWNIPVKNHPMEHFCQEPPNGTFLSRTTKLNIPVKFCFVDFRK